MQITFDPFIPHEKNLVGNILALTTTHPSTSCGSVAEPAMAKNTGTATSVLTSTEGDGGDNAGEANDALHLADASPAPETAPKRRGRKPKAEAAPEPETDEADDAGENPPTVDDVRAALQDYTVAHGIPAGTALLKEFGAARISELNEGDYHAFVKRCGE